MDRIIKKIKDFLRKKTAWGVYKPGRPAGERKPGPQKEPALEGKI